MPSSIASTVDYSERERTEDLEGIPPIEGIAVDVQPPPVGDINNNAKPSISAAEKGKRVGENYAQRAKGGGPRPPPQQQNYRRPHVAPGQIEPPTRENVFVPPSCIFFTQRSIPSAFADGKSLEETFDAIAKREIRKRDLPMIDVVWKDGAYWSLSNRRLAVFSELERRGLAKQVKIKVVQFQGRHHSQLLPFIEFWQRQRASGHGPLRPVPGGLPDGWGGDAPMFSPDLTGDISVIARSAPTCPMEIEKQSSSPGDKSLPPLVKMSSSEDERVGGGSPSKKPPAPFESKHLLRNSQTRASVASASMKRPAAAPIAEVSMVDVESPIASNRNGYAACMCNNVVNVINKAKNTAVKPLAAFFLKNPSATRKYKADLKKPDDVKAFVCGCGHEEKTLVALGKHKDRTGHACWNNNTYDSLRDLILNEDLRISCGGSIITA